MNRQFLSPGGATAVQRIRSRCSKSNRIARSREGKEFSHGLGREREFTHETPSGSRFDRHRSVHWHVQPGSDVRSRPDVKEVTMLEGRTPFLRLTSGRSRTTCAKRSRNSVGSTARPSIRTSSTRAATRSSAPRSGCGPPFNRRRGASPARSGRSSTAAPLGGTAANSDRTPMLP